MATEKRMMFVDVFKKNLCHYCNIYMSDEPCEPGECWVHDVIAQTDTVDAVEVVRCKDCERRIEKRWCYSLHTYNGEPVGVADDFFCAYGKRKSDG